MKTILVPTDFSDLAKNALKFSIKLAHPEKSKILIMHSVHPMLVTSDANTFGFPDVYEEESTKELHKQLDELINFCSAQGVESEKIIIKGFLTDDVAALVDKKNIDLIITGTNGATGIEAYLFGTNSVSILEKVKCPVLIIPAEAKYHGIHKIIYATDFQYGDIVEIEKICQWAQPFNAKVLVVHVNTDIDNVTKDNEYLDWFSKIGDHKISYKNISYKLIYNTDVVNALEKEVEESGADFFCMSTVEKDFFRKIISKSNTKKMAFQSRIPLMALHLSSDHKLK